MTNHFSPGDNPVAQRSNRSASHEIVAWVFIASGIHAMVLMGISVVHTQPSGFPVGVFCSPIGIGLLQHDVWAYQWAVLASVASPLAFLRVLYAMVLGSATEFVPTPFGIPVTAASRPILIVAVTLWLLYCVWRIRVLLRPSVTQLFDGGRNLWRLGPTA